MITELTQDQTNLLDEYRDRWIKIGLDTSRADRLECEKWVTKAYENAKLNPPKNIYWANSPVEAVKLAKDLQKNEGDQSDLVSNFCFGSHEASWLSFYNYCLDVLGLECCEILRPHFEIAKHCGWWLPFDDVAILSEKPIEINLKDGVLHKDGGPAIKYSDGFCVWALNGVRVPQSIAETPWDKIDVHMVLKETNAEIRREIVRKVGIERIVKELGAQMIDKQGEYELLNIDMGDGRMRPYLKMTNPSIGVYHIEGVPPDTKTVRGALAFRNGTEEEPVHLT